jgi:hypothetical protein
VDVPWVALADPAAILVACTDILSDAQREAIEPAHLDLDDREIARCSTNCLNV